MLPAIPLIMPATIRASEKGLDLVDQKRRLKGWAKTCKVWADRATTSTATLRRFWAKVAIQAEAFESICTTIGIEDWQEIVDLEYADEKAVKLSVEDRLRIFQTLKLLPLEQFQELVFALNPPPDIIEGNSQNEKGQALVMWAESPVGGGLHALEAVLDQIVSEKAEISSQNWSLAVGGTVSAETAPEVQAILKLLKAKVGDSLDVVFYEEGSIKIVLSGSPADLRKLQELYESGELSNLAIPTIHAVEQVDENTPSARKARLLTVLKLQGQMLSFSTYANRALTLTRTLSIDLNYINDGANTLALDLDRALANAIDLNRALANAIDLNRARDLAIACTRALDFAYASANTIGRAIAHAHANSMALALANALLNSINLASALFSALANTIDLDLAYANASNLVRDLGYASASDLTRDLVRARNLVRDRAFAHTSALARALARDLDLDLDRAHDRDIARDLDLDRTRNFTRDLDLDLDRTRDFIRDLDLTNADLRGANLTNLNLVGVNLTNADLTNADVTRTVFGDNEGISEEQKHDLERRGAIFQDLPGSDVPVLVRI